MLGCQKLRAVFEVVAYARLDKDSSTSGVNSNIWDGRVVPAAERRDLIEYLKSL